MAEKNPSEVVRDIRLLYQKGNDALSRKTTITPFDLFHPGARQGTDPLRLPQSLAGRPGKEGGRRRRFFQESLEQRQFIAAGCQRTDGAAKESRRGAANRRADPEQRPAKFLRPPAGHRAAKAMEMPRTAVLSLEILVKNSPKDRDLAIEFANAVAEIGEPTRAEKVLAEFCAFVPARQRNRPGAEEHRRAQNPQRRRLRGIGRRAGLLSRYFEGLEGGRVARNRKSACRKPRTWPSASSRNTRRG